MKFFAIATIATVAIASETALGTEGRLEDPWAADLIIPKGMGGKAECAYRLRVAIDESRKVLDICKENKVEDFRNNRKEQEGSCEAERKANELAAKEMAKTCLEGASNLMIGATAAIAIAALF